MLLQTLPRRSAHGLNPSRAATAVRATALAALVALIAHDAHAQAQVEAARRALREAARAAPVTPVPRATTTTASATTASGVAFDLRVVTTLSNPHQMRWGPDGRIWVIERTTGRLLRVDPQTGASSVLLTVADLVTTPWGQDGLLGLAIDPDLGRGMGRDQFFLAMSVRSADPSRGPQVVIRRYTVDVSREVVASAQDILSGLPYGTDHQSGRLVFGPDRRLYYTIGDQGANASSTCRTSRAQQLPTADEVTRQDWRALEGKVLRIGLDGSIPPDNPVLAGVRSPVYAYGIRNAQGLAFGAAGQLYETEHGPKSDDEVNVIRSGDNLGWPRVAGYRDDQSYVFADWSRASDCASLTFSDYVIPPSVPTLAESTFTAPMRAPIATAYTVGTGFDFQRADCAPAYYLCWPTVAPTAVVPWHGALLIASLKNGSIAHVPLDASGTAVAGAATWHLKTVNRYRDLLVSPDGGAFYVATDSAGGTGDMDGRFTTTLANPGAILAFTLR